MKSSNHPRFFLKPFAITSVYVRDMHKPLCVPENPVESQRKPICAQRISSGSIILCQRAKIRATNHNFEILNCVRQ